MYHQALKQHWVAATIFLFVAAATDTFDGILATKLHAKTSHGGLIDMLGDLCMMTGAIAGLVFSGVMPIWLVSAIIICIAIIAGIDILGKPKSRLQLFFNGVHPLYYTAVLVMCMLMYAWKIGLVSVFIAVIVALIFVGLLLLRVKREKVGKWLAHVRMRDE